MRREGKKKKFMSWKSAILNAKSESNLDWKRLLFGGVLSISVDGDYHLCGQCLNVWLHSPWFLFFFFPLFNTSRDFPSLPSVSVGLASSSILPAPSCWEAPGLPISWSCSPAYQQYRAAQPAQHNPSYSNAAVAMKHLLPLSTLFYRQSSLSALNLVRDI